MFKDLDPILHSQLRLAVVSLLVKNAKMEFNDIKSETNATAGNLSVQLKKLEQAGYITITKSFKNNYPLTKAEITEKGLNAFDQYVKNIQQYLK
ncbi:winged helix-turn-helix domain-containing protein [Salinivirga cyanobacteriivorans]|uniref:Bacterial regulatory protein, arsR family n=1 Tax=Salinivirga cyanobacteriivorans TaxID=1307839 RepID=A0A0S2HVZ1_9BACT|nr:transcriptional regulator [Salinivirga cyanobacteriivorans]ALO14200.1 Bacterial regulatory protein, arsR family [Salinivirga cyanobacteriivorans]